MPVENIAGFVRAKRLTSHSAHARWLAQTTDVGFIPRVPEIPSPYHYSPTHCVKVWEGKTVILVETSHRRFDVFIVPPSIAISQTDA